MNEEQEEQIDLEDNMRLLEEAGYRFYRDYGGEYYNQQNVGILHVVTPDGRDIRRPTKDDLPILTKKRIKKEGK